MVEASASRESRGQLSTLLAGVKEQIGAVEHIETWSCVMTGSQADTVHDTLRKDAAVLSEVSALLREHLRDAVCDAVPRTSP